MAFQRPMITDLSAGEVGRKFYGRFDLDVYARGVQKLENWVPFLQGGIITRPPLKYIGESYNNTKARYIPFVVGSSVFEVELTAGALRVWNRDAIVIIAPTNPTATDYDEDEIWGIQYQKVANQLFLVHRGHPIMVLTWHGASTFSFEQWDIDFGTDVPGWAASTVYEEGDVVINGTPDKAYRCITGGTSGGTGPTTEEDDILDGTVHWSWEFTKPFSQTGDYPGAVCYFNGRMCFAGSTNQPDAVWMSMPYDFHGFDFFSLYSYSGLQLKAAEDWADPEVPETEVVSYTQTVIGEGNAIVLQIASENDESIMWLCATEHMVIGTATSEWVITKEVTALNVDTCVHIRSRLGSSEQQAMVVGENPLFLQGNLNKAFLWEYAYNAENAELTSTDLTFLADHMLENGVTQMDFVQMPQPMWVGVTEGKLACLLYAPKYKMSAWFWLSTDGEIQSVCVVPGTTDDDIYLSVLRHGRYCFERLEGIWETGVEMLDSYYSVASAPASITGLERLEGETVMIRNHTDGKWFSGVVSSGALDTSAHTGDQLTIGLGYTCWMQSLPLQTVSSQTGQSAQAQLKRILAVSARVLDSKPFKAGYSQTEDLEEAQTADDEPWIEEYSGDVRIPFQGVWGKEGQLWCVQDLPRRTTILALFPEVDG